MTTTVRTIVTDALFALRLSGLGEDAASEEATYALRIYNRMFAGWAQAGYTFDYPTVTTWRDAWIRARIYNVGDGVIHLAGKTYSCSTAHTSDQDNEPGASYGGAGYWTPHDYTTLALGDVFPLPADFEAAVVALLMKQLAGPFGKALLPEQQMEAAAAEHTLAATYFRVPDAVVDRALIIVPARRRPFTGPMS